MRREGGGIETPGGHTGENVYHMHEYPDLALAKRMLLEKLAKLLRKGTKERNNRNRATREK